MISLNVANFFTKATIHKNTIHKNTKKTQKNTKIQFTKIMAQTAKFARK